MGTAFYIPLMVTDTKDSLRGVQFTGKAHFKSRMEIGIKEAGGIPNSMD